MTKTDIPVMANQLNALAEVFDKKPISEKAALVWFDTLKDFKTEKVCSLLIAWPKTHGKFPTPAEVWKVCNEMASSELEAKAQRENREEVRWEKSERGLEFLKQMSALLKRPAVDPRTHWKRVLDSDSCELSKQYARQALEKKAA
jgi:hypothetical protein